MINLTNTKRFCKEYTRIENYEEAVNDTTNIWHCHHILGEILTREQLRAHDFYLNVPPCMLKFVTSEEHKRLHQNGKPRSAETRRKLSESHKGMKFTEEHRRKLRAAQKARREREAKVND